MQIKAVFPDEGLDEYFFGEVTESGFYYDQEDDLILVGHNEFTGSTTYMVLLAELEQAYPVTDEDLSWPLRPTPEGFRVTLEQ